MAPRHYTRTVYFQMDTLRKFIRFTKLQKLNVPSYSYTYTNKAQIINYNYILGNILNLRYLSGLFWYNCLLDNRIERNNQPLNKKISNIL